MKTRNQSFTPKLLRLAGLAGAFGLVVLANLPARGESNLSAPLPDHFQTAAKPHFCPTSPTTERASVSEVAGALPATAGDTDPALVVTSLEKGTTQAVSTDQPVTLHAGYGQFFSKEDLGLPTTTDAIEVPSWIYLKLDFTF
jgi:hypothetical protein